MKRNYRLFFLITLIFGFQGKLNAQAPGLYINEVSQGPTGSKEWVELLVVGTPTCYTIPTADLRGWYIDDNNGNHATGAGVGIAQGCVRFTTDPMWAAVPIGTIIVIYNDADLDPAIPAQDLSMVDGNCRLVIPISNCTLFEKHTTLPSTAVATYPTTGFTPCGSWTNISMANGDDSFQTINPAGTLFHSVSYGNNTLSTIIYFPAGGAGLVYQMTNSTNNNITTQANWIQVPVATENPGVANNAANQAWICRMNNGCTAPTPISLTTTQVNASCTCTGSATVTATGGFNGCGALYTYSWAPSGGSAATASGLCAGTYTVTVTDINGCSATRSVTITASTAFTLSSAQTNVTCNGASTGSATVTVTGGTGPFTYSWAPTGGTAATASGLAAGTYTVTVTDATLCSGTITVTITQPTAVTATQSQGTILCFGGTTTASVIASGGIAPYTYAWAPSGGTGATSTAIGAGSYTCTITDANGCIITKTFTITAPTAVTATQSIVNVTCNGGTNGSATAVASGGTAPYTYAWTPSGGTAATATGLAAGTYTCTITDANGCTTTNSFTITQPTPIITPTSTTPATCGGTNGTATVTASGGVGPYTYSWAPSGGTGSAASGLAAGSYTVTVTSAGGCTVTAVAVVASTGGITANISASSNVTCFGGNNGSATVSASGGSSPYTYAWTPSGGSAVSATGLIAGTYTATVTDANGCTATASITITQPSVVTATASTTPVLCNGGNTGTATAVGAGGVGPYTYSWAPSGGTTATATGLIAGTYTATVTDANGCTITVTTTVTQPTALTVSTTQIDVSCNGGNTGSATVIAVGGTPTYAYLWTPSGGSAATASGLVAGSFTCTITDGNGCIITTTVTITESPLLTLTTSFVPSTCGNANGSASVVVTGGTPGYIYSWIPSGGTGPNESGLSAGTYTINVTDSKGCAASTTVVITNTGSPTATITTSTNISCFGGNNGSITVIGAGGVAPYTYAWSPSGGTAATETGLIAGSYTVTITDGSGCTAIASATITEPPALTISGSTTNVDCFGNGTGTASVQTSGGTPSYTYSWSPSGGTLATASTLTAGTYTCTATDLNGCTITQSLTVTEPPQLSISVAGFNVTCFNACDGQVVVIPTGGVPNYSFSWNTGCTSPSCTNICAGSYTVDVTDANGCLTSASTAVTQPTAIVITTSEVDAHCNQADGSVSANATGGTGILNYQWISGPAAANWNTIVANTYSVIVTDANGCSDTTTTIVNNVNGVNATLTSVTNLTCFNSNDGTIVTAATGGANPYTYSWAPSGGTGPNASSLAAGTYTLTVTDTSGCTSTVSATITQPSDVTITASATPPAVCAGTGVQLSSSGGGGTPAYIYSWLPGPLVGNTQSITPTTTTTYTAYVVDANGCSDSTTVVVTVNPVPVAALLGDITSGCAPICVNFSDISTIASPGIISSWNWDFGDGNNSTQQNPQHCYFNAGTYTVVLTIMTTDGCISTITMPAYINVFANPVAGFTANPQPATIFNPEIFFTDTSINAVAWNWSFGDVANSSSTLQNPSFVYPDAICYQIILSVTSANGCVDTARQQVCINPEVSIYVPNAFTPNSDGDNDFFFPKGEGIDWATFHMYIFDRWGNLIYETTDISQPWDGRANGGSEIAQIDVYVWKISVKDYIGNPQNLIGHVSLIK